MKMLILQHEVETPPGTTTEWLQQNHISYEILSVPEIQKYPALTEFQGLIICGGSMNVDEAPQNPWLEKEKQFITNCIQARKKIVGLCLGGQLLAETLGARVGPLGQWELGWHPVKFQGQEMPALHWHSYTFDLPSGAELLASSEACGHQAFVYGKNIIGFQFHPEVDERWIQLALMDWDPSWRGAVQDPTTVRALSGAHLRSAKSWYFSFLDRWFKAELSGNSTRQG